MRKPLFLVGTLFLPLWACGDGGEGPPADTTAPSVVIDHPVSQSYLRGEVEVRAHATDEVGVERISLWVEGSEFASETHDALQYQLDTTQLGDGPVEIVVYASDAAENRGEASVAVRVDNTPPTVAFIAPGGGDLVDGVVQVELSAEDAQGVARVGLAVDEATISELEAGPFDFSWDTTMVADGPHRLTATAYDLAGNPASATLEVTVDNSGEVPPDPAELAPLPNPHAPEDFEAGVAFLYTGEDAIQTGVEPGVISGERVAVLRGHVFDEAGAPLPAARVYVLRHDELGQTRSRLDGAFDLAVNGGGRLTVVAEAPGRLSAMRTVATPWRGFAHVPDMALVPLDPLMTNISLGADTLQVARGSEVVDEDGARRATLLVPAGTQAVMELPDGSTQPLTEVAVRATELTVGAMGKARMPGVLPPTSGYTYAVELTADEALAAAATHVRFDRPLPLYVDNFIGAPVGTAVPVGWFDRQAAVWVPSDNGRVLEVVGRAGGLAELDVTGDGAASTPGELSALGITEEERRRLAELYADGAELWRVPIEHFTPWDCNWPYGPPESADPPNQPPPTPPPEPEEDPCEKYKSSVIECPNQVLTEHVPLTGTGHQLAYRSDRARGYLRGNRLQVWLTGDSLNPLVKRVELRIRVEGTDQTWTYPAQTNLSHTFVWDGLDAYGRKVFHGTQASIEIAYVYDVVYYPTQAALDRAFSIVRGRGIDPNAVGFEPRQAQQEALVVQRYTAWLRGFSPQELGAWTIAAHHRYEPERGVLHLGGQAPRGAAGLLSAPALRRVAGTAEAGDTGDGGPAREAKLRTPYALARGPDGALYIADADSHRVRRVGRDGVITTVAGTGQAGFSGDGGPATEAQLNYPAGLSVAPDGSLYIADGENRRIRKVDGDGIITTVAGQTEEDRFEDGIPAIEALLSWPYGVTADPFGGFYVLETSTYKIRHVGPDGIIDAVAGTGERGFAGDGGPARLARIGTVERLVVGPEGDLFFSDSDFDRVRRIAPDGIITTFAGGGDPPEGVGDGGPAIEAKLRSPLGLTLAPDGTLYVAEVTGQRVRRIAPDGVITTVAGTGRLGLAEDDEPAKRSLIYRPNDPVVLPDGDLLFTEIGNRRVVRIAPTLPRRSVDDLYVPSADGGELYQMAPSGQHLATLEPLTGATVRRFEYDPQGRLLSVWARGDRVTEIERDGAGVPVAVVGSFGHRTGLEHDAAGNLTRLVRPDGLDIRFEYDDSGLLTAKTDPRGLRYTYAYAPQGELTRFTDPAGGDTTLSGSSVPDGWSVARTTVEGRVSEYRVEKSRDGTKRVVNLLPNGLAQVTTSWDDLHESTRFTDGTRTDTRFGPDPRFGLTAPVPVSLEVTTPQGVQLERTVSFELTLADDNDPLSLERITKHVDVGADRHSSTFDAATRTLSTTSPEGRHTAAVLDAQGRLTSYTVEGLAPTIVEYDALSRPETLTEGSGPSARLRTASFDDEGWVSSIVGPGARAEAFELDALGRLTAWSRGGGDPVRLTYDANHDIETVTMPGGQLHRFTYTPVGSRASYTAPAVGDEPSTTDYGYDRDRAQVSVQWPGGRQLSIARDAAGRLTALTTPRGTTTYAYDEATGRLAAVTAPEGNAVTFGWDGSLPTVEGWSGEVSGSVAWTYDDKLQRAQQRLNGAAAITFGYDADGRLTSAGAMSVGRDPVTGLISGTTLGNVFTGRSNTPLADLAGMSAAFGAQALWSASFTMDAEGRLAVASEQTLGESHTFAYAYDSAGRLTEVLRDGGQHEAYGYDANGNRTSAAPPTGPAVSAVFDAQDRLLNQGAVGFEYAPSGHLTRRTEGAAVTTYDYDVDGNLRSVTLPDGRVISYVIDALNRRVGRRVDGVMQSGLLYDGRLRIAAELDASGAVRSRFVYATRPHVPDYMVRDGVTYRIVTDRVGSPRLVVDVSSGAVAQRMNYSAFGEVLQDTSPGFTPFGFAGGLYDPDTGLVRFGARDYLPEAGRFTAKDPLGFHDDAFNLYAYAGSDPVDFVDPSGLTKGRPWLYEDCDRWFDEAMEEAECLDNPILEEIAKKEYADCNWILDNWWWIAAKEGESPEEPYRQWWYNNWENNHELDNILRALPEDRREGVSRAWRHNLLQSARNNVNDEHIRDSIDGRWRHNSKDW